MNQTSKKIGRNERCPCGSGKKYKHCHLALDEQQRRAEADKALPEAEAPVETAKIADLPGLLKKVSKMGSAKDRAGFADILSKAGPIIEYFEKQEEIETASTVLEAHRVEFEQLMDDMRAYMDRTSALFAEECFAPLRFTATDIRRAFDQVGYPPTTSIDDRTMETLRAAILYLADKDYRTHSSMHLLLHLPAFVAAGRYMEAWMIQHCSHETAEFDDESNPFLFAMFSQGYDALNDEKKAQTELMLRKFGVAPEKISGMGLAELDAWIQAQGADPDQRAKIEAFMAENPDLRSAAIANIEAMERDSVRLLDLPDASFLLLPPTEVEPWLPGFNQHLAHAMENSPKEPDGTLTKESANQLFHDSIVPLLREMAQAIFTPARIEQLTGQLQEYRRQQFAAADRTVSGYALGAITSLEREDDPTQNYFLINLCFASLKPAMATPTEDLGETPP